MMSGPVLLLKISSSEEILACLRKITKRVDDLCLRINKVHQKNQTMFRNFKLQMQPQAVPVSDLSILNKPNSRKILASSDMDTDLSPGLDSGATIAPGFRGTSNHDPHISRLRTQTRFFIPLSCDLEPDITNRTSRKIILSSDLAPDTSAGLDYGGAIAQ